MEGPNKSSRTDLKVVRKHLIIMFHFVEWLNQTLRSFRHFLFKFRWGYITVHDRKVRSKTVHEVTARYRMVHYKTVHYITVQHYKMIRGTKRYVITELYSLITENVTKRYVVTERSVTENGNFNI